VLFRFCFLSIKDDVSESLVLGVRWSNAAMGICIFYTESMNMCATCLLPAGEKTQIMESVEKEAPLKKQKKLDEAEIKKEGESLKKKEEEESFLKELTEEDDGWEEMTEILQSVFGTDEEECFNDVTQVHELGYKVGADYDNVTMLQEMKEISMEDAFPFYFEGNPKKDGKLTYMEYEHEGPPHLQFWTGKKEGSNRLCLYTKWEEEEIDDKN
jgi:hypothetical protein